jgi:hypothetical protein
MKNNAPWYARWRRPPAEPVMGHVIEEPRPTVWALLWCIWYVGIPVVSLGLALDALVQAITGRCTGVWCWF